MDGKWKLVEYRPGRYAKVSETGTVLGKATPAEVEAWRTAQSQNWTLIEYRPGRYAKISDDGIGLGTASESEVRAWFAAAGADVRSTPRAEKDETRVSTPDADAKSGAAQPSPPILAGMADQDEEANGHEPTASGPAPAAVQPATPTLSAPSLFDADPLDDERKEMAVDHAAGSEPAPRTTSTNNSDVVESGKVEAAEPIAGEGKNPRSAGEDGPDESGDSESELESAEPDPIPTETDRPQPRTTDPAQLETGEPARETEDSLRHVTEDPGPVTAPVNGAPAPGSGASMGLSTQPSSLAREEPDTESAELDVGQNGPQIEDHWLWVDPRQEVDYDPQSFDVASFLERAVSRFQAKPWSGGQKPTRLAVNPVQTPNGLKPAAEALDLELVEDVLVPAQTYRLGIARKHS